MTEREVVAVAILSLLAAGVAASIPVWAAVLASAGAVVAVTRRARRGVAVAAGLIAVLAVSALAVRAEQGLETPVRRGPVSAVATLVSDPQARPGGLVVELSVEGLRYRAFIASELAAPVRGALTGERFPVTGRIVELRGDWGWRASRHLSGALRVQRVGRVTVGSWWWSSANWLHRTVDDGLDSFSPDDRALFLGVVLGDDRDQSEFQRFQFRSSGLAHLLAVSGQNVGFVVVVASPLLRRLRLGPRWVATVGLVTWFAVVTRLEPSVLRAVGMALIAATAAWRGRYTSGLRVVATAVTGLIALDPLLVWSLGFRLSVGASVALVILTRPLARVIRGPRLLGEGLAVSLAAHVGTAPLLVSFAGSVPLFGPIINVAAVPVAGWLMAWGMVVGPLAGRASSSAAAVGGLPARILLWWLSECARVGSSPALPRIGSVGVAGSCAALIAAAALGGRSSEPPRAHSRRRRRRALRLSVLCTATIVLGLSLTVVDALSPGPAVDSVRDGSITLWNRDGSVIVHLRGRPTEPAMMSALIRSRVAKVDLVIVTGGGGLSSAVVLTLRRAMSVGLVLASEPSQIRDARQLVPGEIRVGSVAVTASQDDARRWSVEVPG